MPFLALRPLAPRVAVGLLLVAGCAEQRPGQPTPPPIAIDGEIPAISLSPRLPVTWPASAADAFALQAPGSSVALAVRLAGALPSPGRWDDTDLRFHHPLPDASSLALRARPDGLEDHLAFERAPDGEQADYLLDVRQVAGLRQVDRVVEFLDARGAPRLRMEAPYIVGADGRVAQADVDLGCAHDESPAPPWGRAVVAPGVDECRLTVRWPGRGVSYPAVLDPAWTATSAPANRRHYGAGGTLPDGRMLVAGGVSCVSGICTDLLDTEIYDAATDTWASGAKLPGAHSLVESAVVPGVGLALFGGISVTTDMYLMTVDLYSFDTNQWKSLPLMPRPRVNGKFVVLPGSNRVVAIGGFDNQGTMLLDVDTLDLAGSSWSSGGQIKQGRQLTSATVLPSGKVLLAGGALALTGGLPTRSTELYDPAAKTSTTLLDQAQMPTARLGHAAHAVQIGGKTKVLMISGATEFCDLFDVDSLTWSSTGALAKARSLFASIALPDGSIVAIGGTDSATNVYATTERFDLSTQKWLPAQPMSKGRVAMQSTLLPDGSVVIVGGSPTYGNSFGTSLADAEVFKLLGQGVACTAAGDCASRQCVDGVCCDKACDGVCEACVVAKTKSPSGTCAAVSNETDPDSECDEQEVATCGRTGTCDGQRHCALRPQGQLCGVSSCKSDAGTVQTCDGAGTCKSSLLPCTPFRCKDSTSCATDCDSDDQCVDSAHCESKLCVVDRDTGGGCTRDAECASGHCIDRVCCESVCTGCQACAQALKQDGSADGTCGDTRIGIDPHDDCKETITASCGTNGQCDGQGKCALHAKGTLCESASCVSNGAGGLRTERHECDGSGACLPEAHDCGLFACVVGSCLEACQTDTDCLDSAYCEQGQCLPRKEASQGKACGTGHECVTGLCVDGFCCNTACNGSCEACDAIGSPGTCTAIQGSPRPTHPACPTPDADQPCQARTCDGTLRDGCGGFADKTLVCRARSCSDGTATLATTCDGQGLCPAATSVGCGAFVCQGDQCATSCASDADCSARFRCDLSKTSDTGGHDCVARTVAECSGDGHTIIDPDGSRRDCAPYACASGACRNECDSVLDCVLPNVCDAATHSCLPARPNPDDAGCSVTHQGSGSSSSVAWLAVAAAVGLWRRRRLKALATTALGLLAGCSPDRAPASTETGSASLLEGSAAVRTRLPRQAAGEVRLTTTSTSIAFRMTDAQPVDATERPDGADFIGAFGPGTTMHLRRSETGVEDSVTFTQPPAHEQSDYLIDVRQVAGLRMIERTVEFLDAKGTPRLRMEAPYITGADGRVAQADVDLGCAHDASPLPPWGRAVVAPEVDECRLTVSWAGRGVSYPAVLDPAWTLTKGALFAQGRREHLHGVLPSKGYVMMAGGLRCTSVQCTYNRGTELYDPATDTWTSVNPMINISQQAITAYMPPLGLVAIGGFTQGATYTNGEYYDEATGNWILLPSLPTGRSGATGVQLTDKKRLAFIGGTIDESTTEAVKKIDVFDSSTKTWSDGGQMAVPRAFHSSVLLPDGKVLVTGGGNCGLCGVQSSVAQIYDPDAKTSVQIADMPQPRGLHLSFPIQYQGKPMIVLAAGSTKETTFFDPDGQKWLSGPDMSIARAYPGGALLDGSGGVLIIGGLPLPYAGAFDSAERLDMAKLAWLPAGHITPAYALGGVEKMLDGRVIVAGGVLDSNVSNETTPRSVVFRLLDKGEACTESGECSSGSCVDEVCCESACNGECEACAKAKTGASDGTCAAIAKNADPDDECIEEGPVTCGRTGTCDGQRHCALFADGTACGLTLCVNGAINTATCDGAGKCAVHTSTCFPNVCKDGSSCTAGCQSDKDCATAAHCEGGACVSDGINGTPCTQATECQSGQCADGVCCDEACVGTCRACTQALKQDSSADGTCGNTREGLDPHESCPTDPLISCDRNGSCDGLGKCALYPSGTPCQDNTCISNSEATRSESYACDGEGTCQTAPIDCGAFACVAGACLTACQDDTQCASTGFCSNGVCATLLKIGRTCASNADCDSGNCVDKVCCNKPCQGVCEACDTGVCVPVNGAPHEGHGSCSAGTADKPCEARTCNGSVSTTTCEGWAPPSVVCQPASCASGMSTLEATCDGQGHCPTATSVNCERFACQGDRCATSCASDADCDAAYRCDLLHTTASGGHDCVARTGAYCDADGHTLINADGTAKECAPYACANSACKQECSSVLDCVLPRVCDAASKTCVDIEENPSDGSCALASPVGAASSLLPALWVLAATAARWRRSRAA